MPGILNKFLLAVVLTLLPGTILSAVTTTARLATTQRLTENIPPRTLANEGELVPPPSTKAVEICSFEPGNTTCTNWKPSSQSTIPFSTIGELIQAYDKKNKVNNYITTPSGSRGTAKLTTKYLHPPATGFRAICVSFLYQINGTAETTLKLLEQQYDDANDRQVWQVTGASPTKGQWRFHTSQITSSTPVKISLTATSRGSSSFVALDDIAIYNGSCYLRDGDTVKAYEGSSRALATRAAIWPGQIIPYEFTDGFDNYQVDMIERFFDDIASRTCLQFVERRNENDYVRFVKADRNCITDLGKVGGAQLAQFSDECFDNYGVLSHAILHIVGLRHEHVRSDRDRYVQVNLQNVDTEEHKTAFTKRPAGVDTEVERVRYDKQSVMHFPSDFYAIPGTKAIQSLLDDNERLGNTNGPRDSDFQKVANLYCSGTTMKPIPTTTTREPDFQPEDENPCLETTSIAGRTSGTVSSYVRSDGKYRSGESCSWKIRVTSGKAISMEFAWLDILSSRDCRYDSVTVRDGASDSSPVLAKLCGQQHPTDALITANNAALITFSTADSAGSGFKINWREVNLDDGTYNTNTVLSPVDCSFDNSQCSWLDYSTTTHWQRANIASISTDDHTTQSDYGTYMSVDASTVTGTNKIVTMKSARVQTADGYSCLSFYYRMGDVTRNVGTLEVTAQLSNGEKPLWSSADGNPADAYDNWLRVQIPVDSSMDGSSSYRFSIKATIRRRTTGGIGVDDFTLSQEFCDDSLPNYYETTTEPITLPPRRLTTPRPINPANLLDGCDFEGSFCNWQVSSQSDTAWQRKSGKSTPGSSFGVPYDNTKQTASGQYIFVNSVPRGIARLDKSISSSVGYKCFQFYYMMYGRNVGRLSIKAIPSGGSISDEMVLFEATGNKAAKWIQGRASLDGLTGGYTLRIEASTTGQQDGDIAVDDIGFSTANCYTANFRATPPTTNPAYQTPPNVYFCDFEDENMCDRTLQFTNDDSSLSDQWQTLIPRDVSQYGGPSADRSTNTAVGRFAGFIGMRSGAKVSMATKQYASNENNCMTFWYYMGSYISDSASLNVYQVASGKPDRLIFSARGMSTNREQWINPQVVIPQNSGEFSIRFTAIASGSRSVIVVDNVALSRNDKCSALARIMQLPLTTNRRRRRNAADSPVPSQNLDIGSTRALAAPSLLHCRFAEGSFCDWTATNQWQVVSTSVDQDISGPDDRFAHVSTGRLMVARGNSRSLPSAEMTSNVTGTMTSQLVDVTASRAKQSCLHFYYKVAGWFRDLPMDTLNVYVRGGTSTSSLKRLVASFSGSMTPSEQVDAWIEEKLTVFEAANFQVIFEAVTGDSWMGSIAIDDIELRTNTCPKAGYA